MKSNKDFKIDEVVNYAFNFYNQNGRGLNAQDACIAQIMQMTGLDYATSIDIQTPVLDALMYIEMRDISNQITSQLHNTVSDIIGQRLHSINIGNIQSKISSQPVSLDTSPLQNITENEVIFRNTPNAVNKLVKYTIQQNGLGKGADAIKNVQNFNLSYDLIKDNDAATLNNGLWGYTIKTQTFNLGNNIIGATGLDHLVKGSIGIDYLQKGGKDINLIMQGMFTLPTTSIVNLNLCNNNIGDVGSEILCHALVNAKLPATKSIDVSGNNISDKGAGTIAEALKTGTFSALKRFDASGNDISLVGEKFMLDALKHPSTQSVILLLKRSNDLKIVFSGSKEEKQKLVKETLQTAQDNGVDVKNVAVSKSMYEKIVNFGKIIGNFTWGFGKCNIVPEDAETFAMEAITAKISKKAIAANTAKDAVVCFFDTIDEVSTSLEGIQLIKDLDLVGANSIIDSIE